jgi:hypothetical protein
MSWETALRTKIKFISPKYNLYSGLWIKGERSVEKKLGVFDPPNFNGSIIQDFDCKAIVYPITVYFDGYDHHKTAEKFFKSLSEEVGQWEVIHPVKGSLILQLVSAREVMNPVDDGNFTTFETQWMVPANIERLKTKSEYGFDALMGVLEVIADGLILLQQLRTDVYAALTSFAGAMNAISGLMDKITSQIAITKSLMNESYNAAKASFDNALVAFGINDSDPSALGQALADMTTSTVDEESELTNQLTIYENLITSIIDLAPATVTVEDYNKVIALEFGATIALAAIAKTIVSSQYKTKSEIITAIENITRILNDTINALDTIQAMYGDLDIDKQYFSQTKTYSSLMNLFTTCINFLLSQSYNLKSEKIFTLKKMRSPLEIAVTEYGELGTDDYYYDLFIKTNDLHGNDILLLPAGREVVIYK